MLGAQVYGFTTGVARRPAARRRLTDAHAAELARIIAAHADAPGIVVYLPTHDWQFMFQRPHQMVRALARQGYVCFFCTPNERTDAVIGFRETELRLWVCNVPLEILARLERPIVYVGTAAHRATVSLFDRPVVIYDHYDDLEVSSADPRDHAALLETADVVLVTAQRLADAIRAQRPDTVLVPNGVDYERLRARRPAPGAPAPADLRLMIARGRPIVGYSGALAAWVDYALLERAAKVRSDCEFVLVGVDYDGSLGRSALSRLPNVHWLGMKCHEELPEYLWRFDIGIIPFLVNSITLSTSPIKLFEYAACELPVITTALPECRGVPGVFFGETGDDFIRFLEAALIAHRDPAFRQLLDGVARQNTWTRRAETVVAALPATRPARDEARSLRVA